MGAKVNVKWGNKKYSATIILTSESKAFLERQEITKEGKLIKPGKPALDPESIAKRREIKSDDKAAAECKGNVLQSHTNKLLGIASGHKDVISTTQSGKSDAEEQVPKHQVVKDKVTQVNPISEETSSAQYCDDCIDFPDASPENIQFLSHLLAFTSDRSKRNKKRMLTKNVSDVNEMKNKNGSSGADGSSSTDKKTPSPRTRTFLVKKEVKPGSGVFADKQFLSDLRDFKGKPASLVRCLLRHLLDDSELATMSAKGEGGFPALPTNISDAIKDFVDKESSANFSTESFNRAVNVLCSQLRHLSKKGTGEAVHVIETKRGRKGRSKSDTNNLKSSEPKWTVSPKKKKPKWIVSPRKNVTSPGRDLSSLASSVASSSIKSLDRDINTSRLTPPAAAELEARPPLVKNLFSTNDNSVPPSAPGVHQSSNNSAVSSHQQHPPLLRPNLQPQQPDPRHVQPQHPDPHYVQPQPQDTQKPIQPYQTNPLQYQYPLHYQQQQYYSQYQPGPYYSQYPYPPETVQQYPPSAEHNPSCSYTQL